MFIREALQSKNQGLEALLTTQKKATTYHKKLKSMIKTINEENVEPIVKSMKKEKSCEERLEKILRVLETTLPSQKKTAFLEKQFALRDRLEDTALRQKLDTSIEKVVSQYWLDKDIEISQKKLILSKELGAIDPKLLRKILEASPEGSFERVEHIVGLSQGVFQVVSEFFPKAFLIEILKEFSEEERIPLLTYFLPFSDDLKMREEYKAIIQAIVSMPASDRGNVIAHASTLITENMYGYAKAKVIKSIAQVPEDDREELLALLSLPPIKGKLDGTERGNILEQMVHIAKEDRKDIMTLACTLITGSIDGSGMSNIINRIFEIPKEDREGLVHLLSSSSITEVMDGYEKAAFLKNMGQVPKEDREHVLALANMVITETTHGIGRICNTEKISKMPKEDRESIVKYVNILRDKGLPHRYIGASLDMVGIVPEKERSFLEDPVILDPSLFSSLKIRFEQFLIASFLLPSELRTKENIHVLSQGSKDFHKEILLSLEKKLGDDTLPKNTLIGLADLSQGLMLQYLDITDEHPVLQQAIHLLSVDSLPGENNPFSIFQRHRALKEEPISFTMPVIEEVPFTINLQLLQEIGKASKIKREDLPSMATKEKWFEVAEAWKERIELDEASQELDKFEIGKEELLWPIFEDPQKYLTVLLEQTGPVSDIEAKWRAVIWNILDKSKESREGRFFTEQEEILTTTIMHIQHCKGGKQEGIALAYRLLEDKYKYKITLSSPEEQEAFEEKKEALHFLENFLEKTEAITEKDRAQALIALYNEDTKENAGIFTFLFGDDAAKYLALEESDDDFIYRLSEKGAYKALQLFSEAEKKHGIEKIFESICLLFERVITDDTFLQQLIGEKTDQGAHYSIYLRNFIGHLIGITDEIVFDRNATSIDKEFLKKSREDILQALFTRITPEAFCKEVMEKEITPSLKVFLNEERFFYDKKITKEGAFYLLRKLGFFEA